MQTSDFSRNFLNFVRHFQERNKFIVRAYGLDLLPVESHILTELDIHGNLTGSELSTLLDIDPARVSLVLKNLAKRRLIVRIQRENDALRKPFTLSKSGLAMLHEHDMQANRQLEGMTKQFSRAEIDELAEFFLSLSNRVAAPQSQRRKQEHPLRFLARRLTRWLGQLGNDFYYSGISPLEWHLLLAIRDGEGEVINTHLTERYEASKQALSKCLKKLLKSKLVTVKVSPGDRRQRAYRITSKGEATLADLERRAAKAVSIALGGLPQRAQKSQVITNAYRLVGLQS